MMIYFNNCNNDNYNTQKSKMFKCKLNNEIEYGRKSVTYNTCPNYKVYNYNQK